MNSEYTILVDTREKRPLLFPEWVPVQGASGVPTSIRLRTKRAELSSGDYSLEGSPLAGAVERKGSIREVCANVYSSDRDRFIRAIHRLATSCRSPALILEGSPSDLLQDRTEMQETAGASLSALFRVLAHYRIPILILPGSSPEQRRAMGQVVAYFLIEAALVHPTLTPNVPPPVSITSSSGISRSATLPL